jgi:hypothetical protein
MASLASTDFLLWSHVPESQIGLLAECFDPEECKSLLASCLLPPCASSLPPQASALLNNFFFYSYAFCKERGLSPPKVSTFLSIISEIVAYDISTPYSASYTLAKSHALFTKLLLKHSVERPPSAMLLFTREDVDQIADFMLQQYYRMWRVYKVACCKRVQVRVTQVSGGVECASTKGRGLASADEMDVVTIFPEPAEEEEVEEGGGEGEEGEGEEKKEGGDEEE